MGCSGGSVCVLALWLALLLPLCRARIYTNHWAVRIAGGSEDADRIALKYGYKNLGQIGDLKDYYHFFHSRTIKRSTLSSRGRHNFISMEPKVEWIQQQVVKRRIKRDYKASAPQSIYFNDPKWTSMWYIHCNDDINNCQSDMNIVGAWKRGYTGKNVVVTILDDGIERNHPDLIQNYDTQASYDVNGNDLDPMPRYDASNENKHGTRCAGEVAASANNSHCTVGIAYNAKIGGVRMLDGDVTDMVEAKSLSLQPQHIDIYSASWGPDDDGKTVDGPASLARQAFENGIRMGRKGRGSIFVWASGNGGRSRDHCSCDGYTNSIYTISISSTAESGKKPWYLEECSSTLTTTYSSGENYDRKIITTDLRQRCTDSHTGTSASAPMAAGIIALALEANSLLTWRDVQHIIVKTSRAGHLNAPDWKTNAAGYKVSHLYGFGLMDAEAMVKEAERWKQVPAQHICVENADRQIRTIRPDHIVRSVYKATGCVDNSNNHVIYLEHVVVRITITHPRRGDLSIYLTSPSGTKSQLLANRLFDHSMEGFKNWEFMTTHCWGEKAAGDWILEIHDTPSQLRSQKVPGKLKEWSLILYGTSVHPYSFLHYEKPRSADVVEEDCGIEEYHDENVCRKCSEHCKKCTSSQVCTECRPGMSLQGNKCLMSCDPGSYYNGHRRECESCNRACATCAGTGPEACIKCAENYFMEEWKCVSNCSPGYYLDQESPNTCKKCDASCYSCTGPGEQNCSSCISGYNLESGVCVVSTICKDGEYIDEHGKCHLCDATCYKCTGPDKEDCISCTNTRYFSEGQCVISCPKGRFLSNGQCLLCHHTCKECNDEEPYNCMSCDRDKFQNDRYLFKGQCKETCPEGYYHSAEKTCNPCPHKCKVCTSTNRCLKCDSGFYQDNGLCAKLECGVGEVEDLDYGDCMPCEEGCQTCELSDPRNCSSCVEGFYTFKSRCYRNCPSKTYSLDDTLECRACHQNCLSCDKDMCYWCEEGFFLSDDTCVRNCGEGFYGDEESQECVPCHEDCKTCGGPNVEDCDSCPEGRMLVNGKCTEAAKACEDNSFNKNGKCEECHRSCKTCSGPGKNNCNSCETGSFLTAQQVCAEKCPKKTFANITTGKCEDCTEGCTECTEKRQCLKCLSEEKVKLYLLDGECVNVCPSGYFEDDGNVCTKCSQECETCKDNSTHCLSCVKSYSLNKHSCTKMCPPRFFSRNGVCEHCPHNCKVCNDDGLCIECDPLFFFFEEECVYECPLGYYVETQSKECLFCHDDCSECNGPENDDCISCTDSKALKYKGNCVQKCPEGTYYDLSTEECRDCDKSCITCSGPHLTSCTKCREGMQKDSHGHCVPHKDCHIASYKDQEGRCKNCHESCHRCTGPTWHECLSCNDNTYLLNGTCVEQCPAGYYHDEEQQRCELCHITCETCSGRHSIQCVSCKPDLYKEGKECVFSCRSGHYANISTGTCERCHPSCEHCVGGGHTDCQSCRNKYFFLRAQGRCYKSCPENYYTNTLENTCNRCHPTCKTCNGNGALACDSCYFGYSFSGGLCNSYCLMGEYAISERPNLQCNPCHASCFGCKGPGLSNCTECHASDILTADGRCLSCCDSSLELQSLECCNCTETTEECIVTAAFTVRELEYAGKPALFITTSILLILGIGGVIFLLMRSRSKGPPKEKSGYEKLGNSAKPMPSFEASSSIRDDHVVHYRDRSEREQEDDDDEDEDIVYMGQDGTVYRKFKYGLLEDDEEEEMEYDDESYSFR
ncbi:proprotein convertase subtilisin/kexin type 5b isoform X2 [Amia ocellicauda]|uniref:proprotein convertase subtilisin/kexin type 5b isoform X2 n=1 Tax=Amia ocellicauda TaxID=2972642 RepID=UPI003464C900